MKFLYFRFSYFTFILVNYLQTISFLNSPFYSTIQCSFHDLSTPRFTCCSYLARVSGLTNMRCCKQHFVEGQSSRTTLTGSASKHLSLASTKTHQHKNATKDYSVIFTNWKSTPLKWKKESITVYWKCVFLRINNERNLLFIDAKS